MTWIKINSCIHLKDVYVTFELRTCYFISIDFFIIIFWAIRKIKVWFNCLLIRKFLNPSIYVYSYVFHFVALKWRYNFQLKNLIKSSVFIDRLVKLLLLHIYFVIGFWFPLKEKLFCQPKSKLEKRNHLSFAKMK